MRTTIALLMLLLGSGLGSLPAAGQAPARLAEVGHFGCADCEGPLLFTSITDIDVSGDEVLITDSEPPYLRVFTRDGRPLRAFGTRGEGPGELRAPFGAAFLPDRSVEVFDIRLLRSVRFDASGRPVATRDLPRSAFALAVQRIEGGWLIAGTDFREGTHLYRLDDGATAPDTLFAFDRDFPGTDGPLAPMVNSIAATPDGTAYIQSDGSRYLIRRHAPDGTLDAEYTRDVPRTRRTPEEIEAIRERFGRMAGRLREMGAAEGGARDIGQRAVSPERPHFTAHALAIDAEGRLWVRTERGGPAATVFDLFSTDGRWLGEVRLEAPLGRYAILGAELFGVTRDADDIPLVGRWRIEAGS